MRRAAALVLFTLSLLLVPIGWHNAAAPAAFPGAAPEALAQGDPVIAAAGDIACDPADPDYNNGKGAPHACRMGETADLIVARRPAAVLALGDTQYENGALAKFQVSYEGSWGRFKAITHPAVGNHEYGTRGAAGYFEYFGAAAGEPAKGYYSFDIGAWHLVALNSNCRLAGGCGPGSPQERWLRDDLAANGRKACVLGFWHHPRFSSGPHGGDQTMDTLFRVLYEAGADVVLSGHDHDYERFAQANPDGQPDPTRGIRQFVAGTGGRSYYPFMRLVLTSEVRNSNTFGVLMLTLHPTSYDWEFVPERGKTFTDRGSTNCSPAR